MRKEDKAQLIQELSEKLVENPSFYITDSSEMTVEQVNNLRRKCHESGISLQVAKNTLVKKAMETHDDMFEGLYEVLAGPTSIMWSASSSAPAKVIKEFRKEFEKPILKAAYIETDVFIGDENVDTLSKLKTKEELIGEIVTLLQSPAKNVIAALQSGESQIAGLVKTLSDRPEGEE